MNQSPHTRTPLQVDQWLDIAQTLVPGSGFEAVASAVNEYLSLRTFLVGYSLTLADVAAWAQLQLTLQWDKLRRTGNFGHLARWWVLGVILSKPVW
jgi:glutamyl-tRNA synthetase